MGSSPSPVPSAPSVPQSIAIHHAPTAPIPVEHTSPADTTQHDVVMVVNNPAERRDYWNMIEGAFPGKVRVHPLLARGYGNFVTDVIAGRRILLVLVLERGGLGSILSATQAMTPDTRPQVDHIVHDIERNPMSEQTQRLITALQLEKHMHPIATEKHIRKQLTAWMQKIMPA